MNKALSILKAEQHIEKSLLQMCKYKHNVPPPPIHYAVVTQCINNKTNCHDNNNNNPFFAVSFPAFIS